MENTPPSVYQNQPTVKVQSHPKSPSLASKFSDNKFLLTASVFLWLAIIGIGGYLIGAQRAHQTGKTTNVILPTEAPASEIQLYPTSTPISEVDTILLEPNLVPTADWKTVSFPQNIRVSQGGDTHPGRIQMMIPLNWTTKTVQIRSGDGIGGSLCNDFQITSNDGNTRLTIKPDCGDSDSDYLPISGQVQKVELITKKGNDGHDSYTVRNFDSSANTYHYGSIGVSPGTSININHDQIFPNLILQYEPDRYELWLWTSYDLTYQGDSGNLDPALQTIDTVISTLKFTD